jgi:hypothetical protein
MPSIKLVPVLAATTSLLAIGATGAAARPAGERHARLGGNCRVNIEEAPKLITFGETATIFGRVSCRNAATAQNQQVTVFMHPAAFRPRAFAIASNAKTETGGAYQVTLTGLQTTTAVYVTAAGARSASKRIKVAPSVTLEKPVENTPLLTGGRRPRLRALNGVTFIGKVTPEEQGALVALQRENSTATEEWHRIALGRVGPGGTISIVHRFGEPGVANIRLVVHPLTRNAPGASTPVSYTISQPENPNLTINGSPDPITYGQSVKITGTVAGGANKPVTLMARTLNGTFKPAATGTTDGSGKYEFTQTPLQNTHYKVTSGTVSSTVLVEGVKYAVTATAFPTTAQAGQPVTFTAAVNGAPPGHVVYLERRQPSGIGFHVVDVGTLIGSGTATSCSFVRAFLGSGEGVFRVKVPGDPGHQGKGSELLKLTITPAPAGALRPLAPVRLPPEGQI